MQRHPFVDLVQKITPHEPQGHCRILLSTLYTESPWNRENNLPGRPLLLEIKKPARTDRFTTHQSLPGFIDFIEFSKTFDRSFLLRLISFKLPAEGLHCQSNCRHLVVCITVLTQTHSLEARASIFGQRRHRPAGSQMLKMEPNPSCRIPRFFLMEIVHPVARSMEDILWRDVVLSE
jgi:hypothetical protein